MSDIFDDFTSKTGASSVRSASKTSAKKKPKSVTRTAILVGFVVALIVAIFPIFTSSFWAGDYKGEGTEPVQVTIPEGASGSDIATILVENNVVKSERAFIRECKSDSRCSSIQPGTYELKKEMSAASALSALLDAAHKVEIQITIREGYTKTQAYEQISRLLDVPLDEVTAAASDPAALGLPDVADGEIEGWIAPLTYTFEPGTSAAEALKVMIAARVQQMEDLDIPQDQWEEALIKASIVEREVFNSNDYAKVARVIENRLGDTGSVGGRLQMDSTVLYGVGKIGGSPTQAELSQDTPYNTYIHEGLPPTPIGNPGTAALEGVLNPAGGDWLFFVTVNLDTGETKFASTLEEHEKYVEEYRAWLADNPQ